MARKIVGQGIWRDDEGKERGAEVALAIDDSDACVTVGHINCKGKDLPTGDRRVAHFLGRVEEEIRAVDYANRPIVSYFKEKSRYRRIKHQD